MLQQYDRVVQERDQTVRELEERSLVDPISQNLQQDSSQSRLNTHRNLSWELNNSQSWKSNLVREVALVQDLCHELRNKGTLFQITLETLWRSTNWKSFRRTKESSCKKRRDGKTPASPSQSL